MQLRCRHSKNVLRHDQADSLDQHPLQKRSRARRSILRTGSQAHHGQAFHGPPVIAHHPAVELPPELRPAAVRGLGVREQARQALEQAVLLRVAQVDGTLRRTKELSAERAQYRAGDGRGSAFTSKAMLRCFAAEQALCPGLTMHESLHTHVIESEYTRACRGVLVAPRLTLTLSPEHNTDPHHNSREDLVFAPLRVLVHAGSTHRRRQRRPRVPHGLPHLCMIDKHIRQPSGWSTASEVARVDWAGVLRTHRTGSCPGSDRVKFRVRADTRDALRATLILGGSS